MIIGLALVHSADCQLAMARSSIGEPMAEKLALAIGQSAGVGSK